MPRGASSWMRSTSGSYRSRPERLCRPKALSSRSALAWMFVLGAVGSGPAFAQNSDSADQLPTAAAVPSEQAMAADDIVVTATKRAENLMDIPVAISAFSGEALNKMGISGVQALQTANPAVIFPNTGAYSQPYIRGVGSRLLQNGFDPSVATYVDGRYISRQSAINLEFADIERVEVLKGPQGVLFGRNASAGAIRIITRDVSKDFEGYMKGGFGNYGRLAVQGALNVPLTETLGIRISADTLQRNGFAKNIFPAGQRDWDDRNWTSVRAKLRWQPTDWFDARLTGSYWRSDDIAGNDLIQVGRLDLSTGIRLGGITGRNRKEVASASKDPIKKEEKATELDLHFDLGFADLSTITTYADLNNLLGFEGDGTSARVVDAVIFERSKTFSQEIQLASKGYAPIEWLVGAYLFRDNTHFDTVFDRASAVPASPTASNGQQNVLTKSWAGFGQLKWHVTDQFSLTAGGRYTHDKKDVLLLPSPNRGAVTIAVVPYSDSAKFEKFTPSLTAEYDFGPTLVYAKFARGFKSGGFNYPAGSSAPVVQPEVLDMYELGLKGEFFDRKVRTTLSGYYYDYSDLQVTRAAAAGVTPIVTTQNAANAKLYGLDADLTWFATNALTLSGSVSVQHSEYQDYLANAKVYRGLLPATLGQPGMVDVGFDASGERLLRAPKFAAFASINYDISTSNGKVPINLSYSYKGSYLFDFIFDPADITALETTNVLKQKGYGLVNGRIAYEAESGRWSVSAWVNNLFDKKYFDDVVAAGTGIRASYAPPRTYGLDLEFKF